MQSILVLIAVPFILLNVFSGLGSIIWLAILGQWKQIGIGVALIIAMPIAFSIAQIPSVGLATLLSSRIAPSSKTALVLTVIDSIWTNLLITAWCGFVALRSVHAIDAENTIPILAWGYAIAVSPLMYLSSKDPENSMGGLRTLLTQLFYIGLIGCWYFQAGPGMYIALTAISLLVFPVLAVILWSAEASSVQRI